MYNLSYFKEADQQRILQFLHDHPFAFLTGSNSKGQQVATQVPLLIDNRDGDWFLQGHIMRNTDHHKAFDENPQVLSVFTGPHCYVSGSWYSSPGVASTWNYMSVHISGSIEFMSDQQLEDFMKKLTLKFEDGNHQSPTIYDNLPQEFLGKMMPAIVGFEIKAEGIKNVFKLSQNRDQKSYENIIAQLEARGGESALVAQEMKLRQPELFPPGAAWDPHKFIS
jgi:transcriptional regulator